MTREHLTLYEAAEVSGKSYDTLQQAAYRKRLPCVRKWGRIFIRRADLLAYCQKAKRGRPKNNSTSL